jgi:hypothetical protein
MRILHYRVFCGEPIFSPTQGGLPPKTVQPVRPGNQPFRMQFTTQL